MYKSAGCLFKYGWGLDTASDVVNLNNCYCNLQGSRGEQIVHDIVSFAWVKMHRSASDMGCTLAKPLCNCIYLLQSIFITELSGYVPYLQNDYQSW